MDSLKRLYIFTGKGGVGKTTTSLAFTSYLKKSGKKAKIVYFKNSKLDQKAQEYNEVQKLAESAKIDYIALELLEACRNYISIKMKSKTVANWVIKTPFFKSLINMIPGFSYLIYMGQILELLRDDPELTLVLDSPSSGHALTMFEATKNFNQIFASGLLYNDTQKMLNMLKSKNFLKINILALPTTLAINEAVELQQSITKIDQFQTEVLCNNTLVNYQNEELPDFLANKVENEREALESNANFIKSSIPFSLTERTEAKLKDLESSMESLV